MEPSKQLSWSKLFLIFAAMIWGGIYLANKFTPDGYCLKQMRVLSNEDFIKLAVKQSLKSSPSLRPDIDESEAAIENFYSQHPDCCSVTREKENGFFGDYLETSVVMKIKTKEEDPSRNKPFEYTTWTVMTECGGLVLQSGGG
jgi:hypothetical protein